MKFQEWAVNQFEVKQIKEGKHKGKICFRTPCYDYTIPVEVWECIKEKILKV